MHFLCDAIDLEQSVEGILRKNFWQLQLSDEVHFIVNLYSFPLPLFICPSPMDNNFQNSSLFFC